MWFDSHSHLYELEDPSAAVDRARAAGVAGILVVGTEPDSARTARDLAHTHPGVWAGAAWHPTAVRGWLDEWIEPVEELLRDERVRAVGETGLDHYWDTSFNADQERAFVAHVELAKRFDKALVIHTRSSIEDALRVLEEQDPPARLVFHCWSAEMDLMNRALGLGACISFAGNVSFKKNHELRSLAAAVPDDRLLVETDTPYLSPEPRRGRENEPANVVHVGAAVAGARSQPEAEVAALTTRNAFRLFGISGDGETAAASS